MKDNLQYLAVDRFGQYHGVDKTAEGAVEGCVEAIRNYGEDPEDNEIFVFNLTAAPVAKVERSFKLNWEK